MKNTDDRAAIAHKDRLMRNSRFAGSLIPIQNQIFGYIAPMSEENKTAEIAAALASLGHEARLSVYRLLVRAGDSGLNVGQIGEHLDIPPSTLSHHLRALVQSGLVVQERHGREIVNKPDFDAMANAIAYLTEECCEGVEIKIRAA